MLCCTCSSSQSVILAYQSFIIGSHASQYPSLLAPTTFFVSPRAGYSLPAVVVRASGWGHAHNTLRSQPTQSFALRTKTPYAASASLAESAATDSRRQFSANRYWHVQVNICFEVLRSTNFLPRLADFELPPKLAGRLFSLLLRT